jgi:hypothetical protein
VSADRPTPALVAAQRAARPRDEALALDDLGTARLTRHSFSRAFIRTAARERWTVTRERWDLDGLGRGTIVLRIDLPGRTCRFAAFSDAIGEDERDDRVIAQRWDLAVALVEGDVDDARLDDMRANVTRQEDGRACPGILVWGRANRSERFFDYAVERLAAGLQPEADRIGDAAYLMRSTAFYANGKFGLVDYDGIAEDHPLRLPYRAQMLAAWLTREVSLDIAEHCAAAADDGAVPLDEHWRRFFGLGNATGLGLVPYVIRHPKVLDAWVALRELPLAHALERDLGPDDEARLAELLDRARRRFAEQTTLPTAPYPTGPEIADGLAVVAELLETMRDGSAEPLARVLHDAAAREGIEVRQVVDSLLVELDDSLDDDIERLLHCDEHLAIPLAASCGELGAILDRDYAWARAYDLADPNETAMFWFYSANNMEPRRHRRGVDPGEDVQMGVDIPRMVQALDADLRQADPALPIGDFLIAHPWHRGAVERVAGLADVVYGESHGNLLAGDYVPLHLQRFQLAVYGMDNFCPQSTDWVRVTLFGGAPRADEVATGVDDDWLFAPKPITVA